MDCCVSENRASQRTALRWGGSLIFVATSTVRPSLCHLTGRHICACQSDDTSLKPPRFIRHRRRGGASCPRCASRLADTFVSIRRGAALKPPRCICHRQRSGASCPRCASRLADTFVSIRRGAALKPPRCICHRRRGGGFPVPRKHHWRTDISCQNTLRSSRDFHTPGFVKTSAYGNGYFYNQC